MDKLISRNNLEYFVKLQEFIQARRRLQDFAIMYETYNNVKPSTQISQNYQNQLNNAEVFEEDSEDDWDEDEMGEDEY